MGHKLAWVSDSQIKAIADSLKETSEKMSAIFAGISQRNRPETLLPWNDRQWIALDIITTAVTLCEAQSKQDFNAIDQNRIPHGEKTIAKRAERQVKTIDAKSPRRSPGRPRKKA